MNREIKFRAWDGKEMFYNIMAGHKSKNVCDVDEDGCVWFWHEPPVAVMQFTGLRDVNGKEIYEGDILSWFWLKEEVNAIEFTGGAFCFGDWEHRTFSDKHSEMKIIGNIYENPELLEAKP